MNRLFPSILLMCISLLIGYCQAGVVQPTEPISEQNDDVIPGVNASENVLPVLGSCDSKVFVGIPGPAGPMGLQGFTGMPGPAGSPGLPGTDGSPGPAGPRGMIGRPGPSGKKGLTGDIGSPGRMGITGPSGLPGEQGRMGPRGVRGKQGLKGERGVSGTHGPPGFAGAQGERGRAGPKGDPGVCECPQRSADQSSDRPACRSSRGAMSAFSATFTHAKLQGPNNTVTFETVLSNVGEDFDKNTGKFACSIAGTYFFSMNVYKSDETNYPIVHLLLNGDPKITTMDLGNSKGSASNSVVLVLNVGDEVYLKLRDDRQLHNSEYNITTFSGFLIAEA